MGKVTLLEMQCYFVGSLVRSEDTDEFESV
jgi:hypothetical protein